MVEKTDSNGEKYEEKVCVPKSDDKSRMWIEYVQIIPVLTKAIQELSAKVTALENA